MTATERIHNILQTLPNEQVDQILDFAEFLHHRQLTQFINPQPIPPGTLTGLRGIAKQANHSSEDLQQDYADYLTQKYQ